MVTTERVHDLVAPLFEGTPVELVEVSHDAGVLRVTVDGPGGVGVDDLADLTRRVSRILDDHDPIAGRYTLEVSSPGLERPLRTPDHFRRSIGSLVAVKTTPGTDGERRLRGTLVAADDRTITVAVPDGEGALERTVDHDHIETARTVFEWGPSPKPGSGTKKRKKAARR